MALLIVRRVGTKGVILIRGRRLGSWRILSVVSYIEVFQLGKAYKGDSKASAFDVGLFAMASHKAISI